MIALSIRQPWASLILTYGKDIENRDWATKVRGRVLIHASKGCTQYEFEDAVECAQEILQTPIKLDLKTIQRGGVIGSVEIIDCVEQSESPWFFGRYGFVMRDAKQLPFIPYKGQLGFFDIKMDVLTV